MICTTKKYDRVYCGAQCSEDAIQVVKSLLAVGGVAVLPTAHQVSLSSHCIIYTSYIYNLRRLYHCMLNVRQALSLN